MNDVLVASSLVKRFGAVTALNGVTCRFQRGKIYGLLGPNANGKTTLLSRRARLFLLGEAFDSVDPVTHEKISGILEVFHHDKAN